MGTIFLDEIAEMAPSTQAKVLRVIQEREFQPVGSSQTVKVDTRLITATNKNLDEEIEQGKFREDLYYRINVIELNIPPLRERITDLPILANFMLSRISGNNNQIYNLAEDAIEKLQGIPS